MGQRGAHAYSVRLTIKWLLLWIASSFLAVSSSKPLMERGGPDGCEAPLLPLQLPLWAAAGNGPGVGRRCDFCSCVSVVLAMVHPGGGIPEPQISRRMIVSSCSLLLGARVDSSFRAERHFWGVSVERDVEAVCTL